MSSYKYNEIPHIPNDVLLKIWESVTKYNGNGCWIWNGCTTASGYGVIRIKATPDRFKNFYIHRIVFKISTGVDPSGHNLCHHCDNPPCCNPDHLFLGTQEDNIRDMISKGRGNSSEGLLAAIPVWQDMRLSRNRESVAPCDVRIIREMWESRLFLRKFIMTQFKISRNLFGNVIHRDDWPGVPMIPVGDRTTRPNRRKKIA